MTFGGTTNLRHHIKKKHSTSIQDENNNNVSSHNFDIDSDNDLDEYDENELAHINKKLRIDKSKIYDALIRFVVGTNQPISIVDNPHFRNLTKILNSAYTNPCRQTLAYTLIPDKVI